jgi:AraC-like DNA-binding protein
MRKKPCDRAICRHVSVIGEIAGDGAMRRAAGHTEREDLAPAQRVREAPLGVFSTESLPLAQQFEAWRARVGALIDLTPVGDPRDGYAAANRLWNLGGMAISHVVAPNLGFSRTAAAIRRDGVDHWMILSVRRGVTTYRVGDRCVSVRPGAPAVLPMGLPHDGVRGDAEWCALFLPRDSVAALAPRLDAAAGTVLDTPFGRLLDDFVGSLGETLPSISANDRSRVQPVITALIEAAVGAVPMAGPPGGEGEGATALDLARRGRVMKLMLANLQAHTLGPRALCRLSGLSRSALYRLFEGSGGVAATIQRARLRAAHAALTNPADVRPIGAIAEAFAFSDASTFSRAFRAAFGISPREARLAALVGAAPHRLIGGQSDPADFVGLLRRL